MNNFIGCFGDDAQLFKDQFCIIRNKEPSCHSIHLKNGTLVLSSEIHYFEKNQISILVIGKIFWQHKHAIMEGAVLEAILDSYLTKGMQFLNNIQGQFCLCLIDSYHDEIILACDRLGTFPIFYQEHNNTLIFSNNYMWLTIGSHTDPEIDLQALYHYFYFHFIPSPHTIYKQVKRLEAGHYLIKNNKRTLLVPYWQPASFAKPISFQEAKQQLFHLLEQSIQKGTDPQSGAYLSGGLDSSTIAGMMQKHRSDPIAAFTIGFKSQPFNELHHAERVANHFHLQHFSQIIDSQDLYPILPHLIQHLPQPFGNSSIIGSYFCAQLAVKHGIKTLYAGDGGDELFGGNKRYLDHFWYNRYRNIPKLLRVLFIEWWQNAISVQTHYSLLRKIKKFVCNAQLSIPQREEIYNLACRLELTKAFHPDFIAQIKTTLPLELYQNSFNAQPGKWLSKILCNDLKWVLSDNDLYKVRISASMQKINVYFPMLDEALIQFALQLPDSFKISGTQLRPFFRKALRDFLPKETLHKRKHGFGVPFGEWLLADRALYAYVMDTLNDLKSRSIINPYFIDHLKDDLLKQHPNYYGVMVWLLFVLESWLQIHHDSAKRINKSTLVADQMVI